MMTNLDRLFGRSSTYWILVALWHETKKDIWRFIARRGTGMNNKKLAKWIEKSTLSLPETAIELGIGKSSLYNLLQGQYPPGLALATKIEKLTSGHVKASGWVS